MAKSHKNVEIHFDKDLILRWGIGSFPLNMALMHGNFTNNPDHLVNTTQGELLKRMYIVVSYMALCRLGATFDEHNNYVFGALTRTALFQAQW